MIGTIRRHQKWLWAVIIAATIISFVYLLSPSVKNSNQGPEVSDVNLGSVNGEPITRQQILAAKLEGRIFIRLNTGEWPDSEDKRKSLESFALQRLLLNAELDQFHIVATEAAAARFTKRFLGIKPDEVVPADKILDTLKRLGQEGGVSLDDFDRFARHQVGQEYLMALIGMSGKLITPQEAEVFYRRENEPMQTEMVSFPATNFYSKTPPTQAEIEDFYTKRQADYRVPDRIQVNYVAFSVSNYLDKVLKDQGTNLSDRVEQVYTQQGAAAFKDESGAQLSTDAAKAKIRKEILQYLAMNMAGQEAKTFLNSFAQDHNEQHPYATGDLAAFAKTKNLEVHTTAPFDMKEGTNQLAILPKYLHILFQLRDDDPDDKEHSEIYAPLLAGEESVFVTGLQKRIPSEIQPLSAVHDQVVADYRKSQALEMAKEAATRFEQSLEAGVAQGKTFDTMCAALFIHPQILSPFSLASTSIAELPDKADFNRVMDVATRMHPGQCSPFIPTPEGGFLLYIKGSLPADEAALRRDLPGFVARMRERLEVAAFNAWFGQEFQAHVVPPPSAHPASGG